MKRLNKVFKSFVALTLAVSMFGFGEKVQASSSDAVALQLKGSGTLNIYKTSSLSGGAISYINISGNYGGDVALLDETGSAYQIKIAGVTGWVPKNSGLEPLTIDEVENPSYYSVNDSGEIYHHISADPTKKKYLSTQILGPAPSYLKKKVTYYSYDGIYFYKDYEEMIEDYRDDTTRHALNSDEPYYNYYQYLPMHSKTNLTADDFDDYVRKSLGYTSIPSDYDSLGAKESMLVNAGEDFLEVEDVYGTNAALLFSIAMNESNSGRSELAIERNNLFGLGAFDATPNDAMGFDTLEEGIESFASVHLNWGFLDYNDSRYNGGHVGNKNSGINVTYASDPYWGEKAASYYYKLDKYCGLKDYGKETIAIRTSADRMPIRKEASTTSSTIGSVMSVSNLSYVVLDEEGKFYKVLLDFHVDEDRNVMKHDESLWFEPYDFANNYGYIAQADLMLVNEGSGSSIPSGSNQEITFADSTLKKIVNKAIDSSRSADQAVTEKEASVITSLTIDEAVTSFDGIDALSKLTSLTINQLSTNADLSALSDCGRLTSLKVTAHASSELSFISSLTKLRELTIVSDFITTADDLPSLRKLKNLSELTIDGGKISDASSFESLSATTVSLINQQVKLTLENGQAPNPLKDGSGEWVSLKNADCEGSCAFDYDKKTGLITTDQTSLTLHFDEKLNGTVSRFSGTLTSGVSINPNLSQNGWQQFGSDYVYVENDALAKGWKQISGEWYYFKNDGLMTKGWFKDSSNCWYYMDYTSGKMLTGWRADGSKWYYLNPANGIMQTGWQTISGATYYLTYQGHMAVGTVAIDGRSYTFDEKGVLVSDNGVAGSDVPQANGSSTSQEPQDPQTPTDPQEPIDPTLPQDPQEEQVYPQGTWINSNGSYTYQLSDGSLYKGWLLENNCWYLLDYESGVMNTGWVASGSVWYYLNPANGIMQLNRFIDDNGSRYYVDISGVMVTGSQTIDGVTYTFAANGTLLQ